MDYGDRQERAEYLVKRLRANPDTPPFTSWRGTFTAPQMADEIEGMTELGISIVAVAGLIFTAIMGERLNRNAPMILNGLSKRRLACPDHQPVSYSKTDLGVNMTILRDLSRYKDATSPTRYPDYAKVVQELKIFAEKFGSEVLGPNFEVPIELGFKVRAGQQFKLLVVAKAQGFRDPLLRAYVPDVGYPVVLSFVGEERSVANEGELLQHLYEVLPSNPDIQSHLRALRVLAEDPDDDGYGR